MTNATAHKEGKTEEKESGEAKAVISKKPEKMTDAEFRGAVMSSLTSLMDSHMKLCSNLNTFISNWELARKAGKF